MLNSLPLQKTSILWYLAFFHIRLLLSISYKPYEIPAYVCIGYFPNYILPMHNLWEALNLDPKLIGLYYSHIAFLGKS